MKILVFDELAAETSPGFVSCTTFVQFTNLFQAHMPFDLVVARKTQTGLNAYNWVKIHFPHTKPAQEFVLSDDPQDAVTTYLKTGLSPGA